VQEAPGRVRVRPVGGELSKYGPVWVPCKRPLGGDQALPPVSPILIISLEEVGLGRKHLFCIVGDGLPGKCLACVGSATYSPFSIEGDNGIGIAPIPGV